MQNTIQKRSSPTPLFFAYLFWFGLLSSTVKLNGQSQKVGDLAGAMA
jgi:hypothetical protein